MWRDEAKGCPGRSLGYSFAGRTLDIVVTHDASDFDAFASLVAAQKLYPGSTVVLGRRLAPEVRDFLALHRDRFRTVRHIDVDPAAVTRMIVVDVRRASRLKDFGDVLDRVAQGEVDVHVYDHHGASDDDLAGSVECVEPVGSATTILVELMQAREVEVDAVEATLFMLGVYTDTGSLSHASTTPRDVRVAAWLLERGASLSVVNRYLKAAFSTAQRRVLARLLEVIEVLDFGGVEIAFGTVPMEKAVDGLARVVSQALELEGHAAMFALFPVAGRRVMVVARARAPYVDVGQVLTGVGGGGHQAAASAVVKSVDADEVEDALVAALRADPPRPERVGDLMSTPVHTVAPELVLEELAQTLTAWRHTGAPVVRDGEVVGIVSRRDVEKAARAGRLHLPVSSCMAHEVKTIGPDATLQRALDLMVRHDIGRLPVLVDGRLLGIVSRSDVLRHLYPGGAPVA